MKNQSKNIEVCFKYFFTILIFIFMSSCNKENDFLLFTHSTKDKSSPTSKQLNESLAASVNNFEILSKDLIIKFSDNSSGLKSVFISGSQILDGEIIELRLVMPSDIQQGKYYFDDEIYAYVIRYNISEDYNGQDSDILLEKGKSSNGYISIFRNFDNTIEGSFSFETESSSNPSIDKEVVSGQFTALL